jgi:Restriction endonuclease EcoRV
MDALDLIDWLRRVCSEYRFNVAGVFRSDSLTASWPLTAANPDELERRLAEGGHLLPLPKEPAALANVLEVSIVDFLMARIGQLEGAEALRGSERGYPDLEISGSAFGGGFHAVDVKAARRSPSGRKTQSRITLYTGNTYFAHPDVQMPGSLRAFNEYTSHLDVIMIYTLAPDLPRRVDDLELIVQEPWRIASRERSSTTREYIGAVDYLDALREGRGAFASQDEFYRYWRDYEFKLSKLVQKRLAKVLADQRSELERYRAARPADES